jgi:hypothetical protein
MAMTRLTSRTPLRCATVAAAAIHFARWTAPRAFAAIEPAPNRRSTQNDDEGAAANDELGAGAKHGRQGGDGAAPDASSREQRHGAADESGRACDTEASLGYEG